MSVISVQEQPLNRDGTVTGLVADRSVRRQWLVRVSSKFDSQLSISTDPIYLASTVPQSFGEPHPLNIFYTCRSVRLDPLNWSAWTATADYSTAPINTDEKEKNEQPNPILRLPKFSIDDVEHQVYRWKDAAGDPFVNSAGEPYPAQAFDEAETVVRVRMNVTEWVATWFDLRNTINESQVAIYDGNTTITIAAERGLLKGPRMGELQEENGYSYYPLSAEIRVASDSDIKWDLEIADAGFNYVDDSDNLKRIQVKNEDDELVDCVTEQFLDGDGAPLYPDGVYDSDAEIVYNTFKRGSTANWLVLPFFS